MSRSGYDYDGTPWEMICYRGAVKSAIRGKRGQRLLRDLADALDAMEDKRLVAGDLVREDGSCCALGAIAKRKGIDVSQVDAGYAPEVADVFGIAESLAREIVYVNDELTPPKRQVRTRDHWRLPDGRVFTFRTWIPPGLADSAEHIPEAVTYPTPEEVEENERARWTAVREWVAEHLMKAPR